MQFNLCAWQLLVLSDHNHLILSAPGHEIQSSIRHPVLRCLAAQHPLATLLPCCYDWVKPRFGALNAAPSPDHAGSCGASASPASCASVIEPTPTKGLMGAPTLKRTKPAPSQGWPSSLLRSVTLLCLRLLIVCPDALSVEQATAGLLEWHCMGRCACAATSPCLQCMPVTAGQQAAGLFKQVLGSCPLKLQR